MYGHCEYYRQRLCAISIKVSDADTLMDVLVLEVYEIHRDCLQYNQLIDCDAKDVRCDVSEVLMITYGV